jgi:hypothetical protein
MPVARARHRFNVIPAVALDGLVTALVQEENMCRNGYEFYLEHILVSLNLVIISVDLPSLT